ncbi:FAD-binding protein [Candidatus Palauibacter sp.]|uniref:FAD-binding protein n=1 Tax=Candidatus Palauibacter sp. TaxID=3101350 RepID=UPI003CC565C2
MLRLLNEHHDGTVRVVGAGHSWNPGIETPDALVDLRHLRHVRVHEGRTRVTVGAGCRIGALLKHLTRRGLTLPSIGLIDRQTVAGAVATGTHGSGRHSMSHYVQSMRIACYGANGDARVLTVDSGPMLRAARCSVGALGVVLEVTLACVPQYYVRERCAWRPGLDAVLEKERDAPLQQFYLVPHAWRYLAQERSAAEENRRRGGRGSLPRVLADHDRRAPPCVTEVLRLAAAQPSPGAPRVSAHSAPVHLPPVARHRPQRPSASHAS